VVAVCLCDGELGPRQLTEKRIADPAVLALAAKITVKTDERLNSLYPQQTATRVEISFTDGRTVSRQVDNPKGDPRDPLEAEALGAKLVRFAGDRPRDGLEAIVAMVLDMENLPDVNRLLTLI
jgi:2-methylcitrate dehydratase